MKLQLALEPKNDEIFKWNVRKLSSAEYYLLDYG